MNLASLKLGFCRFGSCGSLESCVRCIDGERHVFVSPEEPWIAVVES